VTLPDAITDALPPDDRMRIGTITSLNPITADVQGTSITASVVNSVNLNVGDVVALLRQDASWLILGEPVAPATGISPMYQAGWTSVSVAASGSVVQSVTFPREFATRAPAMSGNINTAPGATAGWSCRIINITTTGFQIFLFGTAATFTVDVGWIAMARTD
jgi:hypothetical protein